MSNPLMNLIAKLEPEKRAVLAELLRPQPESIAIIGMACRFPGGANTPNAYWDLLKNGRDGIIEVPAERWDIDEFYDPDPFAPNKMYTRYGGFIPEVPYFDSHFFNISPREAMRMDPQQRLLLEVAWEALENAGQTALAGSKTGVFVGISDNQYTQRQLRVDAAASINDPYFGVGSASSAAAGRLSYIFDLQGPNMAIDTACSSSLVALHLASQSLRNKECNLAVVGGVNVIALPEIIINACKMRMLSADGRCKTFDARADGFVLSEGCGVVIVKRLKDAQADGDPILAIILDSAINEDGRSSSLTAPNGLAQQTVIRDALTRAQIPPHLISYLEAHGSGTALGDPIEMESAQTVLGQDRTRPLWMGTAKTNVGHLAPGAGMAGIIKTVLALQHQLIPPHLNLKNPNPNIAWDDSIIQVPTSLTPWEPIAGRRLAGVNAFGWSGTNAHVILEEAPNAKPTPSAHTHHLLFISAKTESALHQATHNLADHLEQNPHLPLADIAYTLQTRRPSFTQRRIVVAQDTPQLITDLQTAEPQRVFTHAATKQRTNITFMFPGVGDHYIGMGRDLYQQEPVFATAVDTCCQYLHPLLNQDLRTLLYPPSEPANPPTTQSHDLRQMLGRTPTTTADGPLQQTEIAQPTVFVIEYALTQLLQSWGITPHALIGYSLGEYVAACIAGVLSLEDALTLVARRAQLIQQLPAGEMLAVPLSETAVQPYLNHTLSLAVINSKQTCVLSGSPDAITQLEASLQQQGIASRRLHTSHAFHSTMMAPIKDTFTQLMQTIPLHPPQIPYLSNVTGQWITDAEATDPTYWARHLCHTVRFADGLTNLLQDPNRIFLEVGPGQSLSSFIKQHPDCHQTQWSQILPTLRYAYITHSDNAFLLETLGKLWLAGVELPWQKRYGTETRTPVALPTYPFERERYWFDPIPGSWLSAINPTPKTGKKPTIADWFYTPHWQETAVPTPTLPINGKWLIFTDTLGLATQLNQQLPTTITVQMGETFVQHNPTHYAIRPHNQQDYQKLCHLLEQNNQLPSHIIHAWSLNQREAGLGNIQHFEAAQINGFYSLLYLTQSLGQHQATESLQLIILFNQVQAIDDTPLHPEKAPLLGLCRVIPQEFPHIRCRAIDVGTHTQLPIAELTATESMVAYRAHKRYHQTFKAKHLTQEVTLRPNGVYLITGGLGSVGLILANYLTQKATPTLILVSRSGLPPRETWPTHITKETAIAAKIRKVQALEAQGATVHILSADVTNTAQMQRVLNHIDQKHGHLHGVIHGAGLVSPQAFQPIQTIDRELCEAHFAPKVHGLYVLEEVLGDRPLDFCLLLSSISSILGGLGFSAYAAANIFMDAYAHAHNQLHASAWKSVNWDAWQMDNGQQALGATLAEFEMTPAEGTQAFALALATSDSQLINSTGDLNARIQQWIQRASPTSQQTAVSRPQLTTTYIPATSTYEKRIAAIWQSILGVEEVGIHDNFFDLGGNSLIGMQLIAKIQEAFDIQVSTVVLFQSPTVAALAKHLQPENPIEVDEEAVQLRQRRQQVRQNINQQDIAIIAMNGRFPGAQNIDQLWQNLCDGLETISFFTKEELLETGIDPLNLDAPNYIRARPIIDNIDQFDAAFFGYSPREAELMDPQHRLFLESAWQTLELAGYAPEQYAGLIGVFGGANLSTYLMQMAKDPTLTNSVNDYQAIIGNDKDSLTTTVSYKLNLKGPSFAVQTFCSTSLVATHLACQSLLNGECDMALAGGVSIRVPQKVGYFYEEGGMESPDGHCRTFDAQAKGSLFGDGVGFVLLKRLEDALKDGDTIHALLKGSAINNDGSLKVGYTAPSVVGQADVVMMALDKAQIHPDTIGYVEAHGTATELGDPIEVASLTRAFRHYSNKVGYCAIGSIKTNMGHLDRAAGVTGLIKAALAVKHGVIPATLHYQSPNPEIDFDNSPFVVNNTLSKWETVDGSPRRAGVNSLGMGGTNAHVIVEQPPTPTPSTASRPFQLLLLSARTEAALDATTQNLNTYLQQNKSVNLADVAYTLQIGRTTFDHRRMVVVQHVADAITTLTTLDSQRLRDHYQPATTHQIAFMFPGVGDHYLQMGRDLYEQEPRFQAAIEQCCQITLPYLNIKIRDILYSTAITPHSGKNGVDLRAMLKQNGHQNSSPEAQRLQQTAIAQPILFAIEYALAQLLMAWGIHPHAMIGYSVGEYVVACLSGVLSLEDALMLTTERAHMIQTLPDGGMLAISLSEEAIQPYLNEEIWLSAHNGANMCVLAGQDAALHRLETQLTRDGIACRRLATEHAFHSPMLTPLSEPLLALAKQATYHPPHIPYVSTVTGTWITDAEAQDPAYWVRHMCQPVRFFEAIRELLREDDYIFLELGPGQALSSFAKQHPDCQREQIPRILTTMRHLYDKQADQAMILNTVGRLWLLGITPKWSNFYEAESRHRLPLPTYPFERQRFWAAPTTQTPHPFTIAQARTPEEAVTSLPREPLADWFYLPGWKQTAPHKPTQLDTSVCWLLFVNTDNTSQQVIHWLRQQKQHLLTIYSGTTFTQTDKTSFTIRPHHQPDYDQLFRELRQQGLTLSKIIHFWSMNHTLTSTTDILNHGLYSLVALVQTAVSFNLPTCQLSVVTTQTQLVSSGETIQAVKATIMGPVRVAPLEYPQIETRCIDVIPPPTDSWQSETFFTNLYGELTAAFDQPLIILRGHQRWVELFEPIHIPPTPPHTQLRPQGVYWITGGLGGIGLAMAEYLAQAGQQLRLILSSRSGLPPRSQWAHIIAAQTEPDTIRRIQGVQRLEANGAEVLILAADVADEAAMTTAVQQVLDRFGTIHAVLHTAGLPGIGLTHLKSIETIEKVLAPKIMGTLVLDHILRDIPLDFLALFSSITSVTGGGPGQVDYCAANAFIDAYAQQQLHHQQQRVVAINWGEWQWNAWDDGLSGYDNQLQQFFRQNRQRFGIQFEEGGDALFRALTRRLPQIVVSTQHFPTIVSLGKQFTAASVLQRMREAQHNRPKHTRPALGTSYVAPRDDLEQKIAIVWGDILGIEDIGINDNFFDLGGNSLIGIDLTTRLRHELDQDHLPAHILYEAPSIRTMADHLRQGEQKTVMVAERQARGETRRALLKKRNNRTRRRKQ